MGTRKLQIEEPGSAPTDAPEEAPQAEAPIAPPIDDSNPATLLDDVPVAPASPIIEVVTPPLIERPTGHLPDQSEIDPSKIKTNTLTKQGWVLPTASAAHAAG